MLGLRRAFNGIVAILALVAASPIAAAGAQGEGPTQTMASDVQVRSDIPWCFECHIWVQELVDPPGQYSAYWFMAGLGYDCGYTTWQCYTCYGDECYPDIGFESGFYSYEDAYAHIIANTNCPDCYNPASPSAVAETLASSGAVEDLVTLIESSNGSVWLNEERRAIQGLGCNDRIVLHLPVGDDLFAEISSRLQEYEWARTAGVVSTPASSLRHHGESSGTD